MSSSTLLDVARARTDAVRARVRTAMRQIEIELEQNDGLYPLNHGRITQAEVCRRAKTSPAVLQGKVHKGTTLIEVNEWVARVNAKLIKGHKKVRAEVTERAEHWKALYQDAARQSNLYHLQLATARSEKRKAESEAEKLREEVVRLQSLLSGGSVVPINSGKGARKGREQT